MGFHHLILILICVSQFCHAQQLEYPRRIIRDLCSQEYKGRGYVDDGVNTAAKYLESEFSKLRLRKFGREFVQTYYFPINTHPDEIRCTLDDTLQKTGIDFLISAGSGSIHGKFSLLHFNTKDSLDKILLLKKIQKGFEHHEAVALHFYNAKDASFLDSCKAYQHFPSLWIRTESQKLTHTISKNVDDIPSLIFIDSALDHHEHIEIDVENKMIPAFNCKNLAGFIKGKKTDSMIVFSAHYDHLGMQGKEAMFPGASDNASGVSMVLFLADYFSRNKPLYNTVFMLFSGEEAGLMGSAYFTSHPTFDLKKIKMLINIDIMGNAEKGIVVVNGEEYRKQFDLLQSINDTGKYLPEVRIRGKTKNSDHFYFSEMGIPSFFIYSNGGLGYYHDVFDTAESINLSNYDKVARLLIEFVSK